MKELIKRITNTGLLKPLPLTGLSKEIKTLREAKNKSQANLRFGAYILVGLAIYGLLFKGLAPETTVQIIQALGF